MASPFNTVTEHCLCEAIDGLSLDVLVICCLSLPDEGDCVTFEPVGKRKLKEYLKRFEQRILLLILTSLCSYDVFLSPQVNKGKHRKSRALQIDDKNPALLNV